MQGLLGTLGKEILFDVQCNDIGGTCIGSDTRTGFFSLRASDPTPADFVHAGTFNVNLGTLLGTSALLLPVSLDYAPDIWSGDLTVTYTYEPKTEAHTPETGSLFLVFSAVAVPGLLQVLRSRRKGSFASWQTYTILSVVKRLLTPAVLCLFSLSMGFGAEDWGPAQFLVGHWTGDGTGQPGHGTGSFSFTPDLQGKVLVRKSFAAYPAADGKPAFRHDDLLIVYRDEASRQMRAMYFDSEDHVIAYSVKPADGGGVVFETEGASNTMRYRLTYSSTGADRLKLKFEIAPPGKDFATYLEGTAHRDSDPK